MIKESENLHASILDRLIDYEPDMSLESSRSQHTGFKEVRNAVIRDIEYLLNTKRCILPVPETYQEVDKSIFTYGLKDYSADNPTAPFFRKKLLKDIRETLIKFEPRLKHVSVHFDAPSDKNQGIGFRISGTLVVDPIAESVVFDTRFDSQRSEYRIVK